MVVEILEDRDTSGASRLRSGQGPSRIHFDTAMFLRGLIGQLENLPPGSEGAEAAFVVNLMWEAYKVALNRSITIISNVNKESAQGENPTAVGVSSIRPDNSLSLVQIAALGGGQLTDSDAEAIQKRVDAFYERTQNRDDGANVDFFTLFGKTGPDVSSVIHQKVVENETQIYLEEKNLKRVNTDYGYIAEYQKQQNREIKAEKKAKAVLVTVLEKRKQNLEEADEQTRGRWDTDYGYIKTYQRQLSREREAERQIQAKQDSDTLARWDEDNETITAYQQQLAKERKAEKQKIVRETISRWDTDYEELNAYQAEQEKQRRHLLGVVGNLEKRGVVGAHIGKNPKTHEWEFRPENFLKNPAIVKRKDAADIVGFIADHPEMIARMGAKKDGVIALFHDTVARAREKAKENLQAVRAKYQAELISSLNKKIARETEIQIQAKHDSDTLIRWNEDYAQLERYSHHVAAEKAAQTKAATRRSTAATIGALERMGILTWQDLDNADPRTFNRERLESRAQDPNDKLSAYLASHRHLLDRLTNHRLRAKTKLGNSWQEGIRLQAERQARLKILQEQAANDAIRLSQLQEAAGNAQQVSTRVQDETVLTLVKTEPDVSMNAQDVQAESSLPASAQSGRVFEGSGRLSHIELMELVAKAEGAVPSTYIPSDLLVRRPVAEVSSEPREVKMPGLRTDLVVAARVENIKTQLRNMIAAAGVTSEEKINQRAEAIFTNMKNAGTAPLSLAGHSDKLPALTSSPAQSKQTNRPRFFAISKFLGKQPWFSRGVSRIGPGSVAERTVRRQARESAAEYLKQKQQARMALQKEQADQKQEEADAGHQAQLHQIDQRSQERMVQVPEIWQKVRDGETLKRWDADYNAVNGYVASLVENGEIQPEQEPAAEIPARPPVSALEREWRRNELEDRARLRHALERKGLGIGEVDDAMQRTVAMQMQTRRGVGVPMPDGTLPDWIQKIDPVLEALDQRQADAKAPTEEMPQVDISAAGINHSGQRLPFPVPSRVVFQASRQLGADVQLAAGE